METLKRDLKRSIDPDAENVVRDRQLVEEFGLLAMLELAWPLIEPRAYVHNWHIEVVAEHLEAVHAGQIRRLIINQPPGTMKSRAVAVMWPVHVWTKDPGFKWIFASYGDTLARRDAIAMRDIIQSEWFQARWPGVHIPHEKSKATFFENDKNGFRWSGSVNGGVTGRHADCQVADDPTKPQDINTKAASPGELENAVNWWKTTMPTRMADPSTGRRVIMAQRLHEMDLPGVMIREGGYEHLCLPMEYEPKRAYSTVLGPVDRRTVQGELLWPDRFNRETVDALKIELGPTNAAAQLDQQPNPAGGGIFKEPWFEHYYLSIPSTAMYYASWDMRFKDDSQTGDWVVGQLWAMLGNDSYLVDQVRGRWSFVETVLQMVACRDNAEMLKRGWGKAISCWVENKANGPAVANTLRTRMPYIELIEPEGGKVSRARAVEPPFAAGNVHLPDPGMFPRVVPWLTDYVKEHLAFPRGVHDDMVDCTTQALHRMYTGNSYLRALLAMK